MPCSISVAPIYLIPNSGAFLSSAASCWALSGSIMGIRLPLASTRGRRQVMIRHRQGEIETTHLAAGKTKPLKCLRTRHFMNEMPVDIDKASAIIAAIHDMGIPDFFVKSQRSIHARLLPSHEEMIKDRKSTRLNSSH